MGGSERRAVSRDVERKRFHRVRQGVYVPRAEWDAATGWDGLRERHIVAMRALAEVAPRPPIFSHWSAGVLHHVPLLAGHLDRVHTTVPDERQRGLDGVAAHVFGLRREEVVRVGPLLATALPRTVVDISGAGPFRGGVMAGDAALYRGLPRDSLDAAVDLAGPRRAQRKIVEVAAFAHPGAESAAESETRCSEFQLGIAPQELQHEVWLHGRLIAVVDSWDDALRIACETDGDEKYLEPKMATNGTGRALIREKKREDLLRSAVSGLARFGSAEACNPIWLRPVLALAGLHPASQKPTLQDYSAVARAAHPRRRPLVSR